MNNLLFTVSLTADYNWSSGYDCLYVVAAKDDEGAKAIVDEYERWPITRVGSGYALDIREIGIAKAGLDCGIVQELTT